MCFVVYPKHIATRICYTPESRPVYLPSHIEQTAQGSKRTGNFYADQLAADGRHKSDPKDKSRYLHNIRESVLTATLNLIDSIQTFSTNQRRRKTTNPMARL